MSITLKLLSRRRWTTQALAREYGVSTRTIYRDIQTLSLSGLPVISFQGQQGGWELDPRYVLDRRLLNAGDVANLLSGLKALQQDMPSVGLRDTFDKINSLITPDKQSDITSRLEHIVIDAQPWAMRRKGTEVLGILHEAIKESRQVQFDYLNLKNEKSERTVEPMTLVLKGNSWYLFAYCLDKQDYRLFRLSRMFDVGLTTLTFVRRDKTLQTYEVSSFCSPKRMTLRLRFSKRVWVAIGDWLGFGGISWDGDWGVIEAELPDDDWIYGVLLAYGDQIVVESPTYVAKRLRAEAEKVVKTYFQI